MLALALLCGCAQLEAAPEAAPQPGLDAAEQPTTAPNVRASAQSRAAHVERNNRQRGRVSMYGSRFSGKRTASGEPFDPKALTMAHRSLPFGTRVRVTNLENDRSVEVVVNDRGPSVAGRIADLSEAAARRLNMVTEGVVDALLEVLH